MWSDWWLHTTLPTTISVHFAPWSWAFSKCARLGNGSSWFFEINWGVFLGPYISQLLPNLSAALLKSNGPHLRVSCSEIFSAALSGKSNQCNALHLQINLILCTRHTLFVPSHQYKYTTFILSTGFVLCSSSLRQLASNRLDGRHMGCLFFHILNDRRICRIYGHRQKNVFILLLCIAIWEERKMTGNATNFAIQIFVEKIVIWKTTKRSNILRNDRKYDKCCQLTFD